jgi:hypothetical protein
MRALPVLLAAALVAAALGAGAAPAPALYPSNSPPPPPAAADSGPSVDGSATPTSVPTATGSLARNRSQRDINESMLDRPVHVLDLPPGVAPTDRSRG